MTSDTDWFEDLLATAALPAFRIERLVALVTGPNRHYHGRDHLAVLWARHRQLGNGTEFHRPRANRLIAQAIAFHDAIVDPQRQDNEQRSADLWREAAQGNPADEIDWVAGTIEATADHLACGTCLSEPGGRMRAWVLDLDLTPLGESQEAFRRNARLLRAENRHLTDAQWERQRITFLQRFADAPQIYRSPVIAAGFEAQAKQNIAEELTRSGRRRRA